MEYISNMMKRGILVALIFLLLSPLKVNNTWAEETQETTGVTSTDIKIGAVYPQTGGDSYFYLSFFAGANSYFDHLNKSGGIYGRKVYLITGDDQGIPTRSIQATNDLLLKSRVFALFNSSPTTPAHIAVAKQLRNKTIPDFYPTAIYSGFRDTNKYPNLLAMGGSTQQEARIAATFSREFFPDKNFTWKNNMFEGDVEVDVRNAWSNMGFTVKPFTNEENTVTIILSSSYSTLQSIKTIKKPLLVSGRTTSYTSRLVFFDQKDLAEVYSINALPLASDKSNEFVRFFESLNSNYSMGAPFDNAFIEGANSAYIFSQALAATGQNPTRSGLVKTFRERGNSFSTATYGSLDFGSGVTAGKASFYVAKFDGLTWSPVSSFYTNELDSNIVTRGPIQGTKLLPNGLPIMDSKASKSSISCMKGKVVKVVSGSNPSCPAGFKKK